MAQTVADILLTRASMNGDNVLKLLSRTMEDILNIFSNNLKDFTVHYFTIRPSLYDIAGFLNIYVYKVV